MLKYSFLLMTLFLFVASCNTDRQEKLEKEEEFEIVCLY